MKKYTRLLLCAAVAALAATGCKSNTENSADATTAAEETTAAAEEELDPGTVTTLGEYVGVELTKDSTEVTDEELETRIQSILDANPEYTEVTRAAEEGDIVNIDYVGLKDGEAFDGGTAEGYDLELGSGAFIDGFEDGLIGVKTGEQRDLNLTFPENYGSEELAGQDVVFQVTVNAVKEVSDAVLDDSFVQRMSDFGTVDEFRADLLKDMEEEKEELAEQALQVAALQAVIGNSELDVNADAVEQQVNNQLAYYESMVQMYGMTLDDYVSIYGMTADQFTEELRTMVETSLEQQLVVNAISEAENMEVNDDDLQFTADQLQMDLDELKENYAEELDAQAMVYKVVNYIIDNAVIK
ncbi:MAG: trigger factor [Clostridiales bacterium]|nr:trigger factor [Clostridiales bacterium]